MTETISAPRAATARRVAAKVPEITVVFWLLKLLSTGIGEVVSDYGGSVSTTYGAIVITAWFGVAMWLQLRLREYRAAYYWSAVLAVAVFGTMVADGIHGDLGFGYAVTTPAFALITALIFFWWYRSEGTLSIHTIDTPRRERFYWAAVLATFALGTAAGDFTATTLNLGFLDSILLFAGVIAIPAIGWWRFNMNPIVAFWFAYIVTRPLGASFSDWFSKPVSGTGLGLGNGTVSLIGLVVFIPIVAWVTIAKIDIQPGHGPHPHAHPTSMPSPTALPCSHQRPSNRHNLRSDERSPRGGADALAATADRSRRRARQSPRDVRRRRDRAPDRDRERRRVGDPGAAQPTGHDRVLRIAVCAADGPRP